MLHALSSPVLRYSVAAAALLALGTVAAATSSSGSIHHLRLHAVDEPGAVYLSAFRNGDVAMRFDDADLQTISISIRADVSDGCRWLGTETLVPIDDRTFVYDYSETILSCAPGSTPARMTPRGGIVTVED